MMVGISAPGSSRTSSVSELVRAYREAIEPYQGRQAKPGAAQAQRSTVLPRCAEPPNGWPRRGLAIRSSHSAAQVLFGQIIAQSPSPLKHHRKPPKAVPWDVPQMRHGLLHHPGPKIRYNNKPISAATKLTPYTESAKNPLKLSGSGNIFSGSGKNICGFGTYGMCRLCIR